MLDFSSISLDEIMDNNDDEIIEKTLSKDIAIIGMSVKLPMADNLNEFWDNLKNGIDCIMNFPDARKKDTNSYIEFIGRKDAKNYSLGGYLQEIDKFDYRYFKISPKEASLMDPNQRLFLETAWKAIEDAGYGGEKLKGTRTGVYFGYNSDVIYDYKRMIYEIEPESGSLAVAGNLTSVIASRISYLLDLRGPSMTVDTACSSSLVAIHLACQGLRNGDCDSALVGSVKINMLPIEGKQKLGIEASDYRAYTFDDRSDGTGMGEGVVTMLLKPLNRAIEDNDNIYAVIKGSSINQDGNSIGLTAPNAVAQEDVIIRAWEDAGVSPETISYIEAHGTGTILGDPIEIDGIQRAFQRYTNKKQFCAIGSIKPNIGHLDNAAGVAGVAKVALALKNKMLPPSINFEKPNKKISFPDSPVHIVDRLTQWKTKNYPRRAGISAFGLSGTNCHLVVEEYIRPEAISKSKEGQTDIFTISAKSKEVLLQLVNEYILYLEGIEQVSLEDICYTANTGRGHYQYRLAIIVSNIEELKNKLSSIRNNTDLMNAKNNIYYGEHEVLEDIDTIFDSNKDKLSAFITLAQQYINGSKIHWDQIYQDEKRSKISLPTYPFEKNRCWISIPELTEDYVSESQSSYKIKKATEVKVQLKGRDNNHYTEAEQNMGKVWSEILGFREISIKDNFYELGGDSISAMKAANYISNKMNIKIEVADILKYQTIEEISACLDEKQSSNKVSEEKIDIQPLEKREYYNTSSAQKRLYILNQFEGIGTSYNVSGMLEINGKLDNLRLNQSLQKLVKKHETLRTYFEIANGEPVQKIHDEVNFKIEFFKVEDKNINNEIENFIRPFNLNEAPLLRAGLFNIETDKSILVIDMHHIISDGTSIGILIKDLMELYTTDSTSEIKFQYKEFAEWQLKYSKTADMQKQEEFWINKFSDEIPILNMPTDYQRPSIQSFEGDSIELKLDIAVTQSLNKLTRDTGTTIYVALLALYNILLSKYSGQEDIVVGSLMSGRTDNALEKIIGMFVNTLPMRNYPEGNKTFMQFINEVREQAYQAYDNQDYQFEDLIDKLQIPRDFSRNPVFDTLFVMQNMEIPEISIEGLNIKPFKYANKTSRFDLAIQAIEEEKQIKLIIEYCTKLFKKDTIEKLSRHFINVINSVISNPDIKIKDISLMDEKETEQLLEVFNNTKHEYPSHKTIHQLFEEKAIEYPNNKAVAYGNSSLTYRELNEQANALANLLRDKGVNNNDIVAVLSERSTEFVTGIMAVLKAGAAYLPINPEYPEDRIRYMLEDSGAKVLLIQDDFRDKIKTDTVQIILNAKNNYSERKANLENINRAEDLAYVIYTSGSTGKPKGVMVEHKALNNFLSTITNRFEGDVTSNDKCLSLTNISFDVSVCELFLPLVSGATLVLFDNDIIPDINKLSDILINEEITFAYIPPTILKEISYTLKASNKAIKLNKMLVGVEPIKDYVLHEYRDLNPSIRIVNGYGPTEATICATMYTYDIAMPTGKTAPIGKPLLNTQIYILDKYSIPVPVGIAGELCIAGDGLARGYLGKPDITAEKFVNNPFIMESRMYKTGDMARWLPDGNIEFVGRVDSQVKIRGYRIELCEIENQLLSYEPITETVVVARQDGSGSKYLCAYVVGNREITVAECRMHLAKVLPDFMIPSYFMQISSIPLTANGKVDRKALPHYDFKEINSARYIAPRNEIEIKLTALWQEILGLEKVGISDNFFELGGHSLKAINIATSIQKDLNLKVSLKEILRRPTIMEMAEYLKELKHNEFISIDTAEEKDYYDLSSAQSRMYVLQQLNPQSTSYNITNALKIEGEIDFEKLTNAFNKLIERHDTLRTSFEIIDEQIKQKVNKEVNFEIEYKEVSEENVKVIINQFIKTFDLQKAPLLRVGLFKLQTQKYILIYDMHHIISDGVSMGILIDEFIKLYEGYELPSLSIQYKDYVVWEKRAENIEKIKLQEKQWLSIFEKGVPLLNMPLDNKRKSTQTFNGSTIQFELDKNLTQELQVLAKKNNTTMNTILLSFYSILLSKYSNQSEIVVGSTVANRSHIDLTNLIGPFINYIPIKSHVDENSKLQEYINIQKQVIEEAYDNQEYPFDKLVEKIGLREVNNRNPIFDTMLIYHSEIETDIENSIKDLKIKQYDLHRQSTTIDFKLDVVLNGENTLNCILEYNTDLFKKESIISLIKYFEILLNKAVKNTEQQISQIEIFSEEEKLQIKEKRELNSLTKPSTTLAVTSTFTSEPIEEYINWWCENLGDNVKTQFAPYNQVFQELLSSDSLISNNKGVNLIMVRFEDWIRDNEGNNQEKFHIIQTNYTRLLEALKNKEKAVPYIAAVFPVSAELGLSIDTVEYIESLNNKWYEALNTINDVYVIDFRNVQDMYSIKEVYNTVTDKAGHMPFTDEYYAALGTIIARKINAIKGNPFKVIAVDCDNTLWKGICGEDGALGIQIQEPYLELQKLLIKKQEEGVLLVLCSKNNEGDVWEVFDKNPNMLLKKQHLAGWEINWEAKSNNIKKLATELNLGIDSFIFIDDSAVECYQMMNNNPEVLTLQLPEDSQQIPMFLKHVWAFDKEKVTLEDRMRTKSYQAEKQRKEIQKTSLTLQNFLKELQPKLYINKLEHEAVSRVSQLTQRTNQFNLSTIRRTKEEIIEILKAKDIKCWTIEVEDKFGEYGLTGVIIMKHSGQNLRLDTFLLSCRVLGRGIEDAILVELGNYCRQQGLSKIIADFYPTKKNQPFREYLQRTNWNQAKESNDYISYEINAEDISAKIDYVACIYDKPAKKIEKDETVNKYEGKTLDEVAATSTSHTQGSLQEANWQISIENESELLHAKYITPLKNYTGAKLLQLPVHSYDNQDILQDIYQGPRNSVEEQLVSIWSNILKVDKIGINDSFFKIGGHSLKAMNLIASIHKQLKAEIPLRVIFETPTIKGISEYLQSVETGIYLEIQEVEERAYYESSSAQKRIYTLQQFDLNSTVYNMPGIIEVEGSLDTERLQLAFDTIVRRHEALRTSFELKEEGVVQIVNKEVELEIEYVDGTEHEIENIYKDFIRAFDLCKAPLLRVRLVNILNNDVLEKQLLMFDMHHIISDGTSIGILIREFVNAYADIQIPKLRVQYKDFAAWQNNLFNSDKIKEQEQYWIQQFLGTELQDEIPVLNMPTDYSRPALQSFDGYNLNYIVDKDISRGLHNIAKQTGSTLYMVMLAAFNVLLSKYSGQEDIVIGSPIAGRPNADVDNIIGMFVNTLALRNYPKGEKTFREFLKEVKECALKAYENQDYQFEELVEKLNIPRDLSRNPLFDIMFVVQNMEMGNLSLESMTLKPLKTDNKISKFDITFTAMELDDEINVNIEYCTKLFNKATMERLFQHYINIINAITENLDKKLKEIDILSDIEKQQLLVDFNNTKNDYMKNKTIQQLFEEQVEKSPNDIAVVYENQEVTYRELNSKSNELAMILRDVGVKADGIVGIIMDRSLEMIVSIMSVLKAGGAYLPIDPEYPTERIEYMLSDSDVSILITKTRVANRNSFNQQLILFDDINMYQGKEKNLQIINKPEDLAYIIYTSGSTGKPKGVMVQHKGIINLNSYLKEFTSKDDRITQFASSAFDASVWEIFMSLLVGARLYIVSEDIIKSYNKFEELLNNEEITITTLPPAYLTYINPENIRTVKKLITAGSAISHQLVNKWKDKVEYINAYGPTETTICASMWEYNSDEINYSSVPIGKPIYNMSVYILDKYNNLQPIGIPGELCIAGDGLAKGYLNMPELTKERFVKNPYLANEIIYRTGDLARWLPDGNIEFLGRIDHQVKIRSFRIELGEIENILLKHEDIKETIVIARDDNNGSKYLCAYVVGDRELTIAELREHISRDLPEYMIPSYFIQLEVLPLTANGKVNQKALPDPDKNIKLVAVYEDPRNEMEENLAEVWQQVLGIEKIGINENFMNLGGDSIKAIQVAAKLQKYQLKLEVKHLLLNPTIKELSKYVAVNSIIAEQGLITGEKGLSPIQSWFFENKFTNQHHWNQAVMLYRKDNFQEDVLRKAIMLLIEHHDALRSTYKIEEDNITQIFKGLEHELYTLDVFNIANENNPTEAISRECDMIQAGMDLVNGPLIKLGLFKTNNGEHLLICIHHLIVDGISWRILLEDFSIAYSRLISNMPVEFQAKTHSYKTWIDSLNTYAVSKELLSEVSYWQNIEETPVCSIRKQVDSVNKIEDGRTVALTLSSDNTEKLLKEVNKAYNTDVNEILITALSYAVKESFAVSNFSISLEGHGRMDNLKDIDVSRTMGWFTSIYPVIVNFKDSDTLSYQIKSIKELIRGVPNKGVGYNILKYMTPSDKAQLKFGLTPEISFNYLGQFETDLNKEIFEISDMPMGKNACEQSERLHPLQIDGIVTGGQLHIGFNYNVHEFDQDIIFGLIQCFEKHLFTIIAHCTGKQDAELTPSDISASNLNIEELDDLFDMLENDEF